MRGEWNMYKLAKTNLIWRTKKGNIAILNTLSKACYIINEEIVDVLNNGEWDKLSNDLLNLFLSSYIIIDNSLSDKDIFKLEQNFFFAATTPLTIFFTPSRVCDLKCNYCIQSNLFECDSNLCISEEIIDKYFNWLQKRLMEWRVEEVRIVFYGGEPLTTDLNIFEYLINKFNELSIKPKYRMITNGYSIDKHKNMLEYIDEIKVTIDGDKNSHDSRRVTKGGAGTYDKIINNISYFLGMSANKKVTIRMNIDKSSRNSALDNAKILANTFPTNQIDFQFSPVDIYDKTLCDKDIHEDISLTAETIAECYEFTNSLGMKPFIWATNCGIHSMSYWVFDTDGNIYKCSSHTGQKDKKVTHVDNDFYYPFFYKIFNDTPEEECYDCTFLGICGGGCYHQKELVGRNSCRKSLFEVLIPRLMEIRDNI